MLNNGLKTKLLVAIVLMVIISTSLPMVIYATDLPTFAVVENRAYKTAESSIKTIQTVAPTFNFQSKSQLLMELSTGEILYANNENEKLLPASVTKVMTLLLIMEAIDDGKIKYEDKVTCSEHASKMGGSQIWFQPGEQLSIDEALKCICVVSANDVSVAMAEHISGSEENFVALMNEKAKILGMNNTHFMNAHGIDEDNHYTTAKDIAIMSRELVLNHPNILKYTSIWMDTIRGGTFGLSNTNKLIRFYDGALGLKTGSTSKALYNLSAVAGRDGMTLIAVVLTAPTSDIRANEVSQLLNYGFANYSVTKLWQKDKDIDEISVNKNITDKLKLVVKNDISILTKKGDKTKYTKEIKIESKLTAPIKAGEKVGIIKYLNNNNEVVKEEDIISKNGIERSNLISYLKKTIKTYAIMGIKIKIT